MLPSRGNLDATQIDHIVVSNYGIFCIETKAYQGWIFGSVYMDYWTQVIYHSKKRFYNPLKQNYAHTKAIEDLLSSQFSDLKIVSLVAFPRADKLKISGLDKTDTMGVGRAVDVVDKIKRYTYIMFSDSQRDEICRILTNANIQDKEARKRHVRGVRDLKR